jgi:hypothetical protein
MSARIAPQKGPAKTLDKSRTRMPSSIRFDVLVPIRYGLLFIKISFSARIPYVSCFIMVTTVPWLGSEDGEIPLG